MICVCQRVLDGVLQRHRPALALGRLKRIVTHRGSYCGLIATSAELIDRTRESWADRA